MADTVTPTNVSTPTPLLTRPTLIPETVLTNLPGGTRRRPYYLPIKNEPGKLALIHKNQLHIDPQYQRNINERLVTRIMANWSWVSCGTLLVAHRKPHDERTRILHYFIMDGQHRWKAATVLENITNLPCLVFELDTLRDEATGFLASNTERRIPTLRDQFKALLVTGDPAARTLNELAEKFSRRVSAPSGAGTISCVSDCMRLLRENKAAFERIFPIVAELCRGSAITGRLIRGMSYIERHMPSKTSLTDQSWHRRIIKVGLPSIELSIKQAAMYENKGDDRTCANGILKVINKNLRLPLILTPNGR